MSVLWTRSLIVLGAAIVLAAVKLSIHSKERTIAQGETIFLELMPVDPRSLMQGDYMALRIQLAADIEAALSRGALDARTRSVPLVVDERRIATLGAGPGPRIAFRLRSDGVWLGTNAYFFTEGTAARYTNARYGEFRLDPQSGEAVLVGLRGAALGPL